MKVHKFLPPFPLAFFFPAPAPDASCGEIGAAGGGLVFPICCLSTALFSVFLGALSFISVLVFFATIAFS